MSGKGKVILVGAGPGGAGLLTLRGKEALENADVVLYDRLVGTEILSLIPAGTEKIDVGKRAGHHPVPQSEINELLLKYVKDGKQVVRLKGGDPYLFGRGAEELEAVWRDGIPFEVVPGITSAVAVPAFAGIPVSHRDFSSSVHIITAHQKDNQKPKIDYESLVKLGGTLIFLMGLETIESVMSGLTRAGMDLSTPAALIENGARSNQRSLISTVKDIAEQAKLKDFKSPSILVVGGVCLLADKLDWFSRLPLKGVSIVVTRRSSDSLLSRKLRELGAYVTDFPCIRTEPLTVGDSVFKSLPQYNWIVFTSPTGADIFFNALKVRKLDVRATYGAKFAAIGAKTASVITNLGINVEFVPQIYNAKELAAGLTFDKNSKSVLLFRAEDGTPELASALRSRGFEVDDAAAYRTIRESGCADGVREMLARGEADYVTFTSASTVQGFTGSLRGFDCAGITAVCIGEETAAEARKHGFSVLVSDTASVDSMIERIKTDRA